MPTAHMRQSASTCRSGDPLLYVPSTCRSLSTRRSTVHADPMRTNSTSKDSVPNSRRRRRSPPKWFRSGSTSSRKRGPTSLCESTSRLRHAVPDIEACVHTRIAALALLQCSSAGTVIRLPRSVVEELEEERGMVAAGHTKFLTMVETAVTLSLSCGILPKRIHASLS